MDSEAADIVYNRSRRLRKPFDRLGVALSDNMNAMCCLLYTSDAADE